MVAFIKIIFRYLKIIRNELEKLYYKLEHCDSLNYTLNKNCKIVYRSFSINNIWPHFMYLGLFLVFLQNWPLNLKRQDLCDNKNRSNSMAMEAANIMWGRMQSKPRVFQAQMNVIVVENPPKWYCHSRLTGTLDYRWCPTMLMTSERHWKRVCPVSGCLLQCYLQ